MRLRQAHQRVTLWANTALRVGLILGRARNTGRPRQTTYMPLNTLLEGVTGGVDPVALGRSLIAALIVVVRRMSVSRRPCSTVLSCSDMARTELTGQ
jgi:hypothetical protein